MTTPVAGTTAHHTPELPVPPGHDWALGPEVPSTGNRVLRAVGWGLLRAAGWRFAGRMPNTPKFVVIVAPHTSNWDFPVGLAAKWALMLECCFWGKDSLFRGPLGWFMRANGGIPVDRANRHAVVEATIAAFAAAPRMVLVLSPEGTRKKVARWRTGFWHVAKGAGVPICCVAFDFPSKTIRLGPTVTADEDTPEAGLERLQGYFAEVTGHNPAQQ
jgi:1-acyl-sn-glycerol-3-phosphate acyltransferase